MAIILPILFLGITLLTYILRNNNNEIRKAFLMASCIYGLCLYAITEILSFFQLLSYSPLTVCWILCLCASLTIFYFTFRKQDLQVKKFLLNLLEKTISAFTTLPLSSKVILCSIIFIFFMTGLTALVAPPNNWDSMTYHMSRVAHWIQNKNINPYPTNLPRQINYTPWAEYAIMHLQILSGSDRFANLVQWFSMIGSVIAVSSLLSFFVKDKKLLMISCLLAATIPMGILQSSSTQNDYVISFWLLCFLYFFYLFKTSGKKEYSFFTGISLGLCLLTKGTGYLYALPFFVLLGVPFLKKCNRTQLKNLPFIVIIALGINAGYYARNFTTFKAVLPPSESSIINQSNKAVFFISNLIQNTAIQMGTPFPSVNRSIEKIVYFLHKKIGMNLENAEGRVGTDKFHFPDHPYHEDHAGNFLHTLLIFVTIISFIFSKDLRKNPYAVAYLFILILTSCLFNYIIRWNLFQSRYHLPLYLLWCPLIALTLPRKQKHISTLLCILLFLCSFPWIFRNQSRPMFGSKNIFNTNRIDQYFHNRPYLSDAYKKTAEYILETKTKKLGLSCGSDDWEYPFWILLNINQTPLTLEHVQIKNPSERIEKSRNYVPEILIDLNNKTANKISYANTEYIRTRKFHPINLYVKSSGKSALQNLKYHFKKMLTLNYMASSLSLNKETMTQMILLRKEEFNEAQLVDSEELRKIAPLLADHFEKNLVPGLTYRLMGFAQNDQKLGAYGTALIAQWNEWLNKNQSTINLLLQE